MGRARESSDVNAVFIQHLFVPRQYEMPRREKEEIKFSVIKEIRMRWVGKTVCH